MGPLLHHSVRVVRSALVACLWLTGRSTFAEQILLGANRVAILFKRDGPDRHQRPEITPTRFDMEIVYHGKDLSDRF